MKHLTWGLSAVETFCCLAVNYSCNMMRKNELPLGARITAKSFGCVRALSAIKLSTPAQIRLQYHLSTDASGLHQSLLWHLAVSYEYRKLAISGCNDVLWCLTPMQKKCFVFPWYKYRGSLLRQCRQSLLLNHLNPMRQSMALQSWLCGQSNFFCFLWHNERCKENLSSSSFDVPYIFPDTAWSTQPFQGLCLSGNDV